MPVIDLDCVREYKEMIGLKFKNQGLNDQILAVMMEALKLKVDESGAKVESMAVMKTLKSKARESEPPR